MYKAIVDYLVKEKNYSEDTIHVDNFSKYEDFRYIISIFFVMCTPYFHSNSPFLTSSGSHSEYALLHKKVVTFLFSKVSNIGEVFQFFDKISHEWQSTKS